MKDAQILLTREECPLGMGQKWNYAAVKDAQIKLVKEDVHQTWGKEETQTLQQRWMH